MLLSVPPMDERPWPSLGRQVCQFLEERAVFGPGSLKGQPCVLDDEKRAIIWRVYEVHPRGSRRAGRRRFQRAGVSLPKGSSKTELMAWIAFAELHPEAPVRCDGFDAYGEPVGRPVADPYIPLVGVSEEQTEELAYGALYVVCTEGPDSGVFDVGLDRILRLDERGRADGKAVALAAAPNARDGARTTFEGFDEPLALDTLVPTPGGWRTIGDLAEGDYVYGRDGRDVRVLGGSPVHMGRRCFRVTFRGGESVVTDGSHRWKAIDWSNPPRGEQVVTTEQMHDRGVDTGHGLRWRLPRDAGFDGRWNVLPIDPYLLGLWLGDGATNAGYIHSDVADYQDLSAGIEHTVSKDSRPGVVRWLPKGLRSAVRSLGVLGDKHIPETYLFSHWTQRLDLLRGLMDSDGHTTKGGNCTFVQKDRKLADDVAVLVRSLGVPASLVRYEDKRSRTGEMWKVHFSPWFCPFRLARKADRATWRARQNGWWPAIESIEPVESVPVRCIAVDSEDHLFLVGRGLHLTHNTHRLYLPRLKEAHQTMLGNLTKRPLDDPWHMEVTTAGMKGQGSIAEDTHAEALAIHEGKYEHPDLYYHHREAGPGHRVLDERGRPAALSVRVAAVAEARGGVGEYAPGQFEDIARQWDRPNADLAYLERVWLNRWSSGSAQAFDMGRWPELARPGQLVAGELITLGFDGARFKDSTGLVGTDVVTGTQEVLGLWERPQDLPDEAEWEVPFDEVDALVADVFKRFQVWQMWGDPPYWVAEFGAWAGKYGDDRVKEWWQNRPKVAAWAVREYREAMGTGELGWAEGSPLADRFTAHMGAAGRNYVNFWDDGDPPQQLFILRKLDPRRKIDASAAAVISWQARLEAVKKGARKRRRGGFGKIR